MDLTYVCDRLIAMAVPCVEGAVYRNDIREVSRFFATRHYGSFLVFNLCEPHEEGGNGNYDTALLYGQVCVFFCAACVCGWLHIWICLLVHLRLTCSNCDYVPLAIINLFCILWCPGNQRMASFPYASMTLSILRGPDSSPTQP